MYGKRRKWDDTEGVREVEFGETFEKLLPGDISKSKLQYLKKLPMKTPKFKEKKNT